MGLTKETDTPERHTKIFRKGQKYVCTTSASCGYKRGEEYTCFINVDGKTSLRGDDGYVDQCTLLVSTFTEVKEKKDDIS